MRAQVLAEASAQLAEEAPLIQDPAGILAVLLAVLAVIFSLAKHPVAGRVFKISQSKYRQVSKQSGRGPAVP